MHKAGLTFPKQLGVSLCCELRSGVEIKALATFDTYRVVFFCGISTILNWDIDFLPECMKLEQKMHYIVVNSLTTRVRAARWLSACGMRHRQELQTKKQSSFGARCVK